MSSYVEFYLKASNDRFLSIGAFSRASKIYGIFNNLLGNYGISTALNKDDLKNIIEQLDEDTLTQKAIIKEYFDLKNTVAAFDNSVEDKMEAIHEIISTINSCEELITENLRTKNFITFLIQLYDEAVDTKFYDNKKALIDPDDYIYAGIDCGIPCDEDVD